MHLHETFQTMSLSFEILYVCILHTYRMVGLKRLFNDHFILKMQKIEMKLFYFCFGCWANTTNYLLDRHGNYALSRCRMFWFMHKLCIVNVNKSMCSNTLGRKDTKKTRPLSALCAFFSLFSQQRDVRTRFLVCLANELNFINKSV